MIYDSDITAIPGVPGQDIEAVAEWSDTARHFGVRDGWYQGFLSRTSEMPVEEAAAEALGIELSSVDFETDWDGKTVVISVSEYHNTIIDGWERQRTRRAISDFFDSKFIG